ncbi:hypothetical protein FEM48_Zijuj05G0124300 [Ziziphus jujuba var. spinosa]|uniref:SKP1 component POZ domain-containing protein n=1 Tax=Ziziphus jujuba var. spinosa TaxID=714518 RepID=A0A978VET7_ZIZJJ|nr:hypothetical protein FEM48_Zijuj05G0124300 [Ziziphus jujuba var. spinosa]
MDEAMAVKSKTIKDMFEDCMDDDSIPIPNINMKTLFRIIERCKNHTDNKITIEKLKKLDDELVPINPDILYDLIPTANYLNIKDLLDQGIQRAANIMKSKSPKEIRLIYGLLVSPSSHIVQHQNSSVTIRHRISDLKIAKA